MADRELFRVGQQGSGDSDPKNIVLARRHSNRCPAVAVKVSNGQAFQPTRVTRAFSRFHQCVQFLLAKRSEVFVVSEPHDNSNEETNEHIQSNITRPWLPYIFAADASGKSAAGRVLP
jgi:hypothetical protein